MAKKRRGGGGAPATAPATGGGGVAEGLDGEAAVPGVDLALRAVQWLGATPRAAEAAGEALLEAARPLIAARAAKYEEDAKAAKLAEVVLGNGRLNGHPSATAIGRKRPHAAIAVAASAGDSVASDKPLLGSEVSDAAKALRALALQPDALASKACKALRAALHPLVEAHLREEKSSPAFRITCMLGQRARWPEAVRLLGELRGQEPGRRPKLGAYQRWIRELNVSEGDDQQLAMLDAIMRVAAGFALGAKASPTSGGSLSWQPPWQVAPSEEVQRKADRAQSGEGPAAGLAERTAKGEAQPTSTVNKMFSLISTRRAEAAAAREAATPNFGPGSWSVLAHETAHERTPPNHFDLDIYACAPGVLPLTSPPLRQARRQAVPGVDGAFGLSDVLSAAECAELRAATEAMGYCPDVPLSSSLDERAQNVVLCATEVQNENLFARVRDLLPQELENETLLGLNRRWRIYRYTEGNLYRKHLDGAWPASGVRTGAQGRQEYVYDAQGGGARSRLTFIVYLNDDFEGGATTFFVPRADAEGTLNAQPVQPRVGAATVFNHGDTGVPLLHEGSCVTKGAKYLLRTEVLYASDQAPEAAKEAARIRGLARKIGLGAGQTSEEPIGAESKEKKVGKRRKMVKKGLKKGAAQEGVGGGDAGPEKANEKRSKKGPRITQPATGKGKRERVKEYKGVRGAKKAMKRG